MKTDNVKQFFKLSEHKNDKNTAFAGSLHSATWLGALALLQSQCTTQEFLRQTQRMRSDIWFRQPVRSDFEVVSEEGLAATANAAWHIHNGVQDDAGSKVEAVHQTYLHLPDWAVAPRAQQWQTLQASVDVEKQQALALQHIQQKMHSQFSVVSQLPPLNLLWCRSISGEPGLHDWRLHERGLQVQLGAAVPIIDPLERLRLQILLGYLAGWSFISSLTSTTGEVDVLVSRVFAVTEPVMLRELTPPLAWLNAAHRESQLLHQLQTQRCARAEVLVRSGHVLLKGLFHVRYVH